MDILEIFEEHQIDAAPESHHHVRSGWVQIDCPFCSKDSKHYRMGYNPTFNYCNCWNCGHHSINSVLVELLGISYGAARDILKDVTTDGVVETKVHTGKLALPKHRHDMLGPHKRYLKNRGFDPKKIQELWQIKAIGPDSPLAWRILIPIHHHGEVVSWTTRTVSEQKGVLRYRSASADAESIPHKKILYGADYARDAVIVLEGPIDVWAGGPGCVCTFGLTISNEQIAAIAKYPTRAICLDSAPAAQRVAKKLAATLGSLPGETYNVTLHSKDLGEASYYDEIKTLRETFLY